MKSIIGLKMGWKILGWIHSSQNKDKWRAVVRPRVLFSVVILFLALEL